jgi:hypothetical protein
MMAMTDSVFDRGGDPFAGHDKGFGIHTPDARDSLREQAEKAKAAAKKTRKAWEEQEFAKSFKTFIHTNFMDAIPESTHQNPPPPAVPSLLNTISYMMGVKDTPNIAENLRKAFEKTPYIIAHALDRDMDAITDKVMFEHQQDVANKVFPPRALHVSSKGVYAARDADIDAEMAYTMGMTASLQMACAVQRRADPKKLSVTLNGSDRDQLFMMKAAEHFGLSVKNPVDYAKFDETLRHDVDRQWQEFLVAQNARMNEPEVTVMPSVTDLVRSEKGYDLATTVPLVYDSTIVPEFNLTGSHLKALPDPKPKQLPGRVTPFFRRLSQED